MDKLKSLVGQIKSTSYAANTMKDMIIKAVEETDKEFKENGYFLRSGKIIEVEQIFVYDILYFSMFGYPHYFLVHHIENDLVYGIVLSSKDKAHSLYQIENDRYFKGNYATNVYTSIPLEDALKCYTRTFESKKEATKIFNIVRKHILTGIR